MTKERKRNYIVVTFPWSEKIGGVIFMHHLVHELNRLGEKAYLWQSPRLYPAGLRETLKFWKRPSPMTVNPLLDTPIASHADLNDETIVVYPELLKGNPLKSKNIVRWLLYRPGLVHEYEFGPDEMFFRVDEIMDLPELTGGAPDLYLWKINPTYRNENRPDRKGVCYLLRKGKDKPRIPETEVEGAICVDGMSHEQMNETFNQCETFYSYDEASMYSQFAVISGCASVVVPGLFKTHSEWASVHPNGLYGIAYGTAPEELERARQTRHLLIENMQARERAGIDTVRQFVAKTHERFWSDQV